MAIALAIATAAATAAACAADTDTTSRRGDDPVTTAQQPSAPSASTSTAPSMPNERSARALQQARRYQFPDPIGALQREHGLAPTMLPPGRHTTDSLGIEVTLDLDRWWRLEWEEPGSFALTRPDAALGGGAPRIVFLRPVGLAPITRVGDADLFSGEHTSPPDDLGAWIDEVDQLMVQDTGALSVGGRDALWYDAAVVDGSGPLMEECDPTTCIHTVWAGGSQSFVARWGESIRFYDFPDSSGPIYVIVTAPPDEVAEWRRVTVALLGSVTFGESTPHPVPSDVSVGLERAHEPGSTTGFVAFPEVLATAERFSVSFQRPGLLSFQPWVSYEHRSINRPELVRALATDTGTTIDDVADLEAALEAGGLNRLGADAVLDRTVSAFEGDDVVGLLRRAELGDADDTRFVLWPAEPYTRLRAWVIAGPSGPLLLAAMTDVDADENISEAVSEAVQMLAAIELR